MNKKIRAIIITVMLLATTLLAVSCAEKTPYDDYDSEGYTASIKYDANGGMFTTNVEVITDSYNLSELPAGANGTKQLALLSPDDARRGTGNAFLASNAGYFLAGWYTERTPILNDAGQPLDADGNVAADSGKDIAYTYAGRWDFENDRLEIAPADATTSNEPSLTLYAAWIPEFKYEFYAVGSDELIGSYTFDPNYISEINVPQWNAETGTLKMERFPTLEDKTLNGVYLDRAGEQTVDGLTIKHTGSYDAQSAVAQDPVMKIYLDYIDGEWFHIYTAKQLLSNATAGGCYEICADLDFTGLEWKTSLLHGNFKGKIVGNGHVFKNISAVQTDTRKMNTGLFGHLAAGAVIENVIFENVSVTIQSGTLQPDSSFGLFAGSVEEGVTVSGVTFINAALLIHSNANLPESSSIGLLCGTGVLAGMDLSQIRCEAVGENAADIVITVDGNEVTVGMAQQHVVYH